MTKDEAIRILPDMKGAGSEWDMAIDVVIEALNHIADADKKVSFSRFQKNDLISKASVCEILADVFPTDGEKVVYVEEIENAYQKIIELPYAQPETYKEKLKEIADALSEKFAYMNTCLNERDIILGYLGVSRPSKTHCNTDCTNTKCKSHRCNKRLPSAQPESQWISCSERLPQPNEEDADGFIKAYLVQDSRWMDVARWNGDCWIAWGYGTALTNVIAWMPLPEPYRKDGD